MSFQDLIDLIQHFDYKPRSYSGRYMNGRECLGVRLERGEEITFAVRLMEEAHLREWDNEQMMELAEVLKSNRTDDLGLGTIIYFPSIEWDEDEEYETETEDDE